MSPPTRWSCFACALVTHDDLSPATTPLLHGLEVTTLPRPGERLATIATTNDLHFGEIECGHVDGYEKGPFFSVPLGAEPYPAMMNRLAVAEIATHGPDAVIVKGDLTSRGRPEEYAAFLDCYAGTFGERLTHVRDNYDCYRGQMYANTAFQEAAVPGRSWPSSTPVGPARQTERSAGSSSSSSTSSPPGPTCR